MNNSDSIKNGLYIFIIITLLFIPLGCEQFYQIIDKQILTDYNERLEKVNKIMAEHDELGNNINSNISNITKQRDLLHDYLIKGVIWIVVLKEFQQFLEINEKRIRRVGINPDYVRDNVLNSIRVIQQNEVNFRKTLAVQDVLQPFLKRYKR